MPRTGMQRNINPWPDNPMGHPASDLKYRFQWSFPIVISPHDPNGDLRGREHDVQDRPTKARAGTPISGDLTRNDKSRQGSSGGPITKDNTSIEYYCTHLHGQRIADHEGPDLGRLRRRLGATSRATAARRGPTSRRRRTCCRNGRRSMRSSRRRTIPRPLTSPRQCTSRTISNRIFIKTTDYGKTWTKIVNGIPDDHFTRVIREDPNRKGLLFAGTEFGIYVSYDAGENWQSIQLNLPIVPITDLAFHKRDDELVVATQGRAFWIMDDLPLLRVLKGETPTDDVNLFAPKEAMRAEGGGRGPRGFIPGGANPPAGVIVDYWLKDRPTGEVRIEILDAAGKLVNKYTSKAPIAPARPKTQRQ